ncbi:hypothetical protein GCM10009785_26660 [Brooklawnia cerclae]|uniref:Uncharacterized protein n=1 Tax=Brooklawnia cerclae TaxID=349934 RepID=A0ABX0SH87_9ACTN|nr:hypothetical protein [Brooklawnia cerclae]NIH57325.1 hypothetical protein [Brooklawnia cerclae]
MALAWIACESTTGEPICDLPDLSIDEIGSTLCGYWSGPGSLPIPGAPADWRRAIAPWASYLVLLDDDTPVWGGWTTSSKLTEDDEATFGVASWEAHLAKRYCGNTAYNAVAETQIVAGVLASYVADGGPAMLVEVLSDSAAGDLNVSDADDRTVLSVLSEISGREGGPEWTVTWRHLTGPERYIPVVQVAPRIGQTVPSGFAPSAVFDMPGCLSSFERGEDWADGKGANDVMATAVADGNDRLTSGHFAFNDPDRPKLEYRWTPSTSITEESTLRSHAASKLAVAKDGATTWSLSAAVESAPRLGVDWSVGDDIGYSIAHPSVSDPLRDTSGAQVADSEGRPLWQPVTGTARCIGWKLTLSGVQTVTPILHDAEEV